MKNQPNKIKAFHLLWLLIAFVLVLLPSVRFDRKIIQGLQVPIIIFVVFGINWLLDNNDVMIKKFRRIILVAIVIFFVLPNVQLLVRDAQIYYTNRNSLFTITPGLSEGIDWLKFHTNYQDSILTSYSTSNLIPGLIGRPVYHGHYDQTVNAGLKYDIVRNMLQSSVAHTDPLKSFSKAESIDYILVDKEVNAYGGLDINNRPYLKLAFENSDVQIYEVDQSRLD